MAAMLYFFKGTTLLYGGQEFENDHLPSLFEKDPIDRSGGKDLIALMRRMYELKRTALDAEDDFLARADDEHAIAVLERVGKGVRKLGVFSLHSEQAEIEVSAPDGDYVNLIDGETVSVKNSKIVCAGRPIIFTLPA